jgi:hypothetical protein
VADARARHDRWADVEAEHSRKARTAAARADHHGFYLTWRDVVTNFTCGRPDGTRLDGGFTIDDWVGEIAIIGGLRRRVLELVSAVYLTALTSRTVGLPIAAASRPVTRTMLARARALGCAPMHRNVHSGVHLTGWHGTARCMQADGRLTATNTDRQCFAAAVMVIVGREPQTTGSTFPATFLVETATEIKAKCAAIAKAYKADRANKMLPDAHDDGVSDPVTDTESSTSTSTANDGSVTPEGAAPGPSTLPRRSSRKRQHGVDVGGAAATPGAAPWHNAKKKKKKKKNLQAKKKKKNLQPELQSGAVPPPSASPWASSLATMYLTKTVFPDAAETEAPPEPAAGPAVPMGHEGVFITETPAEIHEAQELVRGFLEPHTKEFVEWARKIRTKAEKAMQDPDNAVLTAWRDGGKVAFEEDHDGVVVDLVRCQPSYQPSLARAAWHRLTVMPPSPNTRTRTHTRARTHIDLRRVPGNCYRWR